MQRPFFACYDEQVHWLGQLVPVFGEENFFAKMSTVPCVMHEPRSYAGIFIGPPMNANKRQSMMLAATWPFLAIADSADQRA